VEDLPPASRVEERDTYDVLHKPGNTRGLPGSDQGADLAKLIILHGHRDFWVAITKYQTAAQAARPVDTPACQSRCPDIRSPGRIGVQMSASWLFDRGHSGLLADLNEAAGAAADRPFVDSRG
jgi:hypothetical protein